MHYKATLILCASSLFLFGCTQRFQDTSATLKEAFWGFDNIEVTREQVESLPYASLYARINESHQIFMVLAYAETNPDTGVMQLKWMSSDKALIVTENGRIVKTLLLPEANLVGLTATSPIPQPSSKEHFWQATYDWQPNYHFGYEAYVSSKKISEQKTASLLWEKDTTLVEETISFKRHSTSMTNQFWVDQQGQVVKSAQWLVPEKLHIELEVLKPATLQ